jgi:hypothetical protein
MTILTEAGSVFFISNGREDCCYFLPNVVGALSIVSVFHRKNGTPEKTPEKGMSSSFKC